MEATVTLRLIFFGLVAFTPDTYTCDQPMQALLIDARNPPVASDGCPIHRHTPEIMFQSPTCQSPCRIDRGLCRCELKRDLIHIGDKAGDDCYDQWKDDKKKAQGKYCEDYATEDMKYLSHMKWLHFWKPFTRLRRECSAVCPDGALCPLVTAQVNFAPHRIDVCTLSGERGREASSIPAACCEQEHEDEPFRAPAFRFRPLSSRNILDFLGLIAWGRNRRQLAEITMFQQRLRVPNAVLDGTTPCPSELLLEVASFNGTGHYTFKVDVFPVEVEYVEEDGKTTKTSYECYADLIVANSAADHIQHDLLYERCAAGLVARDFELFHDLWSSPRRPIDRSVPQFPLHLKLKEVEEVPECDPSQTLDLLMAQILRQGTTTPICPNTCSSPPKK